MYYSPMSQYPKSMPNEMKAAINAERQMYPISPYEVQVIQALRRVQFGNLTFHMYNGIASRYSYNTSFIIDPEGLKQEESTK